eukprot:657311-Rhodomonas_salina.1
MEQSTLQLEEDDAEEQLGHVEPEGDEGGPPPRAAPDHLAGPSPQPTLSRKNASINRSPLGGVAPNIA